MSTANDTQSRRSAASITAIVEAPGPDPRRAVVVGVDGSESNRAAVRWATHEAEASGRPLTLVCVCDETSTSDVEDGTVLRRIADNLAGEHPELTVDHDLTVGNPIRSLLDCSADQGLLVVGKRGHGTFARLLLGSTSIAVAGRSRVPTVIIPEGWEQTRHLHQPVVVGLDPDDVHPEALTYAFAEARRRGVRLVVTHGWEANPRLFRDPATASDDVADWQDQCMSRVRKAVAPSRTAFPGVHVELAPRHGHAATVLLEESGSAQLLVLGRHDDGRLGGFPFGSVTRNVLHHADVPVAVIPPAAAVPN